MKAAASIVGASSQRFDFNEFENTVYATRVKRAPPRFWQKTKLEMAVGMWAGVSEFWRAIVGCVDLLVECAEAVAKGTCHWERDASAYSN